MWTSIWQGYSYAGRWVVTLADGSSVFVKTSADERSARWLRDEYNVYAHIVGSFMPEVVGWCGDGSYPVLILEDLSREEWLPPWSWQRIQRVLATLSEVARAEIGAVSLPVLDQERRRLDGWLIVAGDPEPFLQLGLCSHEWLAYSLPDLMAAADTAVLAGDDMLHLDIRSHNLCFRDDRVILVDWNGACIGNAYFDIAKWLPSLHAEGGPSPEEILTRGWAVRGLP
jgi:hypothetical protein